MNMHEPVPQIILHPNDITALAEVVKGYLAFVRRSVPVSRQRNAQIRTLQRLHQRLLALSYTAQTQSEQKCFPLTADEIRALDDALRGFAMLVRRMIPPSRDRDETLRDIENLRQQVARMITPSTTISTSLQKR